MVSNRWSTVSWPVLAAVMMSPLLLDCGNLPKNLPGPLGDVAGAANCPNFASVEAIGSVDFAKEFGVDVDAAAKLKGSLSASVELQALAASIEGELKVACKKMAEDLGAKVEGTTAEAACKAAARGIADAKAKAGGSFKLEITPPVCKASMSAMADCAGSCDAKLKGGKVEAKCEGGQLAGSCTAKCEGACQLEAGGTCDGTCSGACDAKFSGSCGGKCDGKCDGKATAAGGAECKGKCDGKCDAAGKGDCKGSCKGECQLKAAADCKGTCVGKCSVEMKEPKCTGTVQPPEMSAECKAHCDAKVNGKVDCSPATVIVKATGTSDMKAAEKLVATLQANFPAVLKVAVGMAEKAPKVAAGVQAVVEGVKGSVGGMAKGGPTMAAKLTGCVAAPFKGAIDAAASIKANVNVSVEVKASASAEGKASGGAKG